MQLLRFALVLAVVEVVFEPISMCIMEESNQATFAQVPSKLMDDPKRPVEIDDDHSDQCLVGVSPWSRVGKSALGFYLLWRFGHGKPFHAGLAWDAMDLGLKVMSKVLSGWKKVI